MKTRTSTIILFAAVALLVWHYHLDPGGVVLSDIPNDPNVTEGWPWLVGAIGIILIPFGLLVRQSENEQNEAAKKQRAISQETKRRRQRNADNIRIRWSAETGIPQYRR
jgi:hypothetical protein